MPNIIITLLANKRARVTTDGLDTVIGTHPGGYQVVAGENLATEVQVNYPELYRGLNCYVHMQNSRGEYATIMLDGDASAKTFAIPSTMTLAGNTLFTFYAENADTAEKTVWVPVVIPITATGVDYHKVAMSDPDTLIEAIRYLSEWPTIQAEINITLARAQEIITDAYVLPEGGIPVSDLSSEVQSRLISRDAGGVFITY